jgi:predicted alpha/beta superfamily hydrolase
VDQEYEISVWLPPDYEQSPDKTYPVVYVLDGDALFGVAAHMGWMMVVGQDVPPMIVVGIGWAITGFDDWNYRRSRDLMPCVAEMLPISGGADDFLAFIDAELIPFVSSNYRTDPTGRMIGGASAGGLFALYALLQKPDLFRGIIAGSPAVWACAEMMSELEKSLAESGKPVNAALYMSFGSLEGEWVKPAEALFNTIASRNYAGLALKYELLDGETHTSVLARAYVTGLRAVFQMLTPPTA